MSVRILICEDDPLIALDLQAIVEGDGHEVIGVCDSTVGASALLSAPVDFALLDIDLRDGKSFGVAQALEARGVPFAFVSAARRSELPEGLRDAPFVGKPYREDAILGALKQH